MSQDPQPPPAGRSWREINQDVQSRAMSAKGWRRRQLLWLKVGTAAVAAAGLAWVGWALHDAVRHDRAALADAVRSEPVKEVVLITDGVLTQKWVTERLALPKGIKLMELDLSALRDRLLAQGQVRVAVLSRSFPDTLVVTLQERTPVVRLQADLGGQPRQLVVGRDGVAYEGVNYEPALLASLPWLDGVKLYRKGAGFEPVAGMDAVADLLTKAQLQAPHLYRTWVIVSLARLALRDQILVKSQDIPEIIFTRREDFYKQLAQLDYIVDTAAHVPADEPLHFQSVNLTLTGQVPVRLTRTPDELDKVKPPVGQIPRFSLPSPAPKSKKNDL